MIDIRSDLQRAFDEGYEKGKADKPSAVDLSSVYSTAYKSGYEKGKADRPQGEWIRTERMGTFKLYDCSVCGIHIEAPWSFCPNCGARMKGKDNE